MGEKKSMLTIEQEEICKVLIDHADTKSEVIKAMEVIPGLRKTDLLLFINKEWRARNIDGKKISLMKRSYNEIAEILLDLTEKLIAGKVTEVEITLNKAKSKQVPDDMHKSLCHNFFNLDAIRGKKLHLTDFDRIKLNLIDPETERQYQVLIWDINKLKFISVK